MKYGVTKSLTADFTYNTDFAQVEADEAQVNLTRFSLSFPEKREFFLEGQGSVRLRRRRRQRDRRRRIEQRRAHHLLQPAHRAERLARRAGHRRRPRHRQGRALEHRRAQHGDRRCACGVDADELHRRTRCAATSCGAAPSAASITRRSVSTRRARRQRRLGSRRELWVSTRTSTSAATSRSRGPRDGAATT